jgi:putative membrane protein
MIFDIEETATDLTNEESLIAIMIFLITLIAQLVLYWIILRRYLFSSQDKSFVIEKGLIYRRKIDIPYKNIHSLSIKRRFTDIILGLSTIQIDTGTTASILPEASLVVDRLYAPILKDFIEAKKTDDTLILPAPNQHEKQTETKPDKSYQAKWFELFFMGVLKPGFLITILVLQVICFGFLMTFAYLDPEIERQTFFITILIFDLSSILLIAFLLMIFQLLKYYKYQLIIKDENITYKYGFFNKVEFKLEKRRINAIQVNRSLLYRLFGYYQLNVSVLGIGDQIHNDNKQIESKSLLPITRFDKVLEMLDYLECNQEEKTIIKPTIFKELNYLFLPIFSIILLMVFPFLIISYNPLDYLTAFLTSILTLIVLIIGLFLRLKHHQIEITEGFYIFQKGAYTIKRTYIRKNRIQSISYLQNPLLLLENIGNIRVRYKDIAGNIVMRCFEPKYFNLVKDKII